MQPLIRLLGTSAHLARGLGTVAAMRINPQMRYEHEAARWNAGLLRCLNVDCRQIGAPIGGGALIVANHISWLDISAIVAATPTRFLSKAEVRDWPVAGWLADANRTLYIERGRHGVNAIVEQLSPLLAEGARITVFPEGTTSDGHRVGRFFARLFSAPIKAGVPIQPLAISYSLDRAGNNIAPFVGDDDLARHILRLLRSPGGLTVTLHWLDPIDSRGRRRDELADAAHAAIVRARSMQLHSAASRA